MLPMNPMGSSSSCAVFLWLRGVAVVLFVVNAACDTPPTNQAHYWGGVSPSLEAGTRGAVTRTPGDGDAASIEEEEPDAETPLPEARDGSMKLDTRTVAGADAMNPSSRSDTGPLMPARDAASSPMVGGAVSAACSVQVTLTTVSPKGKYQPDNIGAVWVADSTGKFVKTLKVWAARRIQHLAAWNRATSAAALSRNTVDAITGATSGSHKTHVAKWNCTDTKKVPVKPGSYRVHMEVTENNGAGPTRFVEFVLGDEALKLSPPDMNSFKGIQISVTP